MFRALKEGLCAGEGWEKKPITRFWDWNWLRTHSEETPEGCDCCFKIRVILIPFILGLSIGLAFLASPLWGLFYFFGICFILGIIVGVS